MSLKIKLALQAVLLLLISDGYAQSESLGVKLVGVEQDRTEVERPQVLIEELIAYHSYPLLPYIFFAESSAQIPSRYNRPDTDDLRSFSESRFKGSNNVHVYQHLLPIVAKRLKKLKSRIKIVGHSDLDEGRDLGGSRANSVAHYLHSVGVHEEQILIESRLRPAKASNTSTEEGREENRRVEFHSDEISLFDPVEVLDTFRRATPPILKFYLYNYDLPHIKEWYLNVLQADRRLFQSLGSSKLPPHVEWNIQENSRKFPELTDSLQYVLELVDNGGTIHRAEGKFAIDVRTIQKKIRLRMADTEYDTYNLILFDFDSSELLADHKPVVSKVKENIESDSVLSLKVIGYADILGDPEYNRKLSLARAHSFAQAIRDNEIAAKYHLTPTIDGVGSTILLHDNSLPEGRFYSRTVQVFVERSVQR